MHTGSILVYPFSIPRATRQQWRRTAQTTAPCHSNTTRFQMSRNSRTTAGSGDLCMHACRQTTYLSPRCYTCEPCANHARRDDARKRCGVSGVLVICCARCKWHDDGDRGTDIVEKVRLARQPPGRQRRMRGARRVWVVR